MTTLEAQHEVITDLILENKKLKQERDEAREEIKEWKTLCLWGGTPEHIHGFIRGQQSRIQHLECERDEAREKIERQADIGCSFQKTNPAMCGRYKQERDESQEKYATEATEHMLAINKICNQRDEAITTIEDAKRALKATDYEGILLAAMRVKEERDDAREEARLLKAILDLIKKEAQ